MSQQMSPLTYDVTARRVDVRGSLAKTKDAEIVLDTAMAGRADAFNPAELFLASIAACMIKGIERVTPMLKFDLRGVEVKLHGVRHRKGSLEVPGMADNVILSDRCKRSTRSSTAFLYWWKLERSSPTRSDHWEHGDTVHRGDHRSAGWSGGDAVGRSRMQ